MAGIGWKLYYHRETSRKLAECLRHNSALKSYSNVPIEALPNANVSSNFGRLPHSLRRLLFWGHPDVVLSYYNGRQPERAIFAWEITDAAPATDHWMQRFPGLVGACEVGVPSVFILKFKVRTKAWKSDLKPEFFYAYNRVMEIHQIPIYIANWLSDVKGVLPEDPKYPGVPDLTSEPMKDSLAFLNMVIDYAIHGRDFRELYRERLIVDLRNKLIVKISEIPMPSAYRRLCVLGKDGITSTGEALEYIRRKIGRDLPPIPERITKRNRTIIFVPTLDDSEGNLLERIRKKNGTPYNGMPLAFDFMFCRIGATPRERDVNLFIDLSELSFRDFAEFHKKIHDKSPLGSRESPSADMLPKYSLHLTQGYVHEIKNFIRQYCYAADMIVLKDFVVPLF